MLTSIAGRRWRPTLFLALSLLVLLLFSGRAEASVGDRLTDFRECVEVCKTENCAPGKPQTPIPLLHRLLLWDCPAECDYTCQHIVTKRRLAAEEGVVQFHGKWPFLRLLGMQEPLSVLFSLGNLAAHLRGLSKVRAAIPPAYTLRPFYEVLAYVGAASWTFSAIFHTRDFLLTEQLDYFAAGANVLYGMYYTTVRLWRLDRAGDPRRRSVLRAWTGLCLSLYAAHVAYLKLWRWDYGYNMAANVACGVVQNIMWTWFSYSKYRETKSPWAMVPGFTVAWVMLAMSLELFDFPPIWGALDAHSLWHLGTIFPTVLMYNFLIKDAQDDIAKTRLKA